MALTARRAACGRCSLVHASATVSATRSISCPPNWWRSHRLCARPCAPSATPCSTEHASARACGCLRWASAYATLSTASPPPWGLPMARVCDAGSKRRKLGWYTVLADPQMPVTSTLLAQAHNAIERKLFAMKGFHHPKGSQQAFLTGLVHLYNLVPYQRRAQHAGQCGVEVEGGTVPTRDWFLNLQILTSGGFR